MFLRTMLNLAVSENIKYAIPAKAGISFVPFLRRQESHRRKAQTVAEGVQLPATLRRYRFLPSQEWDGGKAGIAGRAKFSVGAAKSAAERKNSRRAANSDKKTTADAHFCELFALFCIGAKKNGTAGRFRAIIPKASEEARFCPYREIVMKKVILSFRTAFKAVVRALNNVFVPTLNFKGGGGAGI